MDYKRIIKSRKVRIWILQALDFVPDKAMIKMQYLVKMGRKLNLKKPRRMTEKLQWYKLNYRSPLMAQCADKYEVRSYIKECGYEKILNTCYGVYDSQEEIDFNILPDSFVLKDTLGSGGNSVIIVKNKKEMNEKTVRRLLKTWTKESINKKHPGREWVYDGRKHRIIAEKYIHSNPEEGGLIDYKFFCFNGTVEYLYVVADRKAGDKAGFGIFDKDFKDTKAILVEQKPLRRVVHKPDNYEEMKSLAEIIAKPFPEARIDFYNVDGKIIFGEITFFDASGYSKYAPDSFDYEMGAKFDLNKGTN